MADTKKDKQCKCILITEANERVASGHLMEIAELSRLLGISGFNSVILVNSDAPEGLKRRITGDVIEYSENVENGINTICDAIDHTENGIVVTDLREVSDEWIRAIKKRTDCPLICIDEFGNRMLSADMIINPMIDPYYWDYKGSRAKIYAGHEYLILPDGIEKYHKQKKNINGQIKNVCISMGGVDYYGTTNKLIEWLADDIEGVEWNVVIGAGFCRDKELRSLIEKKRSRINVYKNIDFIYELFFEADLAVCAGGNTLHELACIGTPAIVVPSRDHEYRNGKSYEEKGFGLCTDITQNVRKDDIVSFYDRIKSFSIREKMSVSGKRITDGKGGRRTVDIITETARK